VDNNLTTLYLCDNSDYELPGSDLIACWSSLEEWEGVYSIPVVVENKSEYLKNKYLTWLHNLGNSTINGQRLVEHMSLRDDFSMWWMSLLNEKNLLKSPQIYNIFRLMALEFIVAREGVKKIVVTIADASIQDVIETWCRNANLEYELDCNSSLSGKKGMKTFFSSLPHVLQAVVYFFYYSIFRWPARRSLNNSSYYEGDKTACFISYLDNFDVDAVDKGGFYSRYWTALHSLLEREGIHSNWLHLFVNGDTAENPKKSAELINECNSKREKNQRHAILDGRLNLTILLGVIKDYLSLLLISWRIRNIKHLFKPSDSEISYWHFLKKDWRSSLYGKTAIENCFFLNLFEAEMKYMPRQKLGFYLQENQAWERSLIYAWRKAGHGKLIGVPHTTIRTWDLRYYFLPIEYQNNLTFTLPMPDKVALNGMAAVRAFCKAGFPEEMMLKVEALRYLYLAKQPISAKKRTRQPSDKIMVLILGDYSKKVTDKQMKFLADAAHNLADNIVLTLKPHPNCLCVEDDWPDLKLKITNRPLDEIVGMYDIAITSNRTSSALDAYFSGVLVLTILEPNGFNMSPLRDQSGVYFVNSPEELTEALQMAFQNTTSQQSNNDFFFLDAELPRWSHFFAN